MQEHGATLHGFRSTLSTWAEEQDDGKAYPQPVIKSVLAHGKGDAVTTAYLRSDLFKARRKLMEAWSAFAMGSVEVAPDIRHKTSAVGVEPTDG